MPYPTKAYNQSRGEWFELYNNSTQPINLVNWTIRENNRKNNESFRVKSNLIIRPRQYIVFGTSNKTSINGGLVVNYVYNAKSLDLANSDQLMVVNRNGRRIDMVKWNTSNFPNDAAAGSSIALRSINYVSPNTVGARWCLSSTPYGQGDRGTPGRANDCPPFVVGRPTAPTQQRPPVIVRPPVARPVAATPVAVPVVARPVAITAPRPPVAGTPVVTVPVARPVVATPPSVTAPTAARPVAATPITAPVIRPPVATTPVVNPRPVVATPTRPVVPSGGAGRVSYAPSSEPSLVIGSGIIDTPTRSPLSAPIRLPTKAPVRAPTKPPTRVPVRVPTKAPVRAPTTPTATVPSNAPRAAQITSYINEITQTNRTIAVPPNNTDPLLYKAPEDLALQWLINSDVLRLTPNSPAAKFRMTQRYVLTSMYFQPYSPGTSFPNRSNWFDGEECTWYGVTCATRNVGDGLTQSAITAIEYPYYYSLQGAITPELGLLSHMESLVLSSNKLIGTIPASLGRLTRLTSLNLESNTLTGALPESLGLLTRLTSLNIGSNTLTGRLPDSLKQLTQLTSLNVQSNDIVGTVPSSYGSMTLLTYAYFDDNQLSGTMPSSLCNRTGYISLRADCPNEVTCTCCNNCRV